MTETVYLTPDEIADRWQMSSMFVRRLIWSGRIRSTKFGRAVRISLADLQKYEEDSQVTSKRKKLRQKRGRKNRRNLSTCHIVKESGR